MEKRRDWIAAVEENLFEAWGSLADTPGVDYDRNDRFIRFVGGIPFPLCNSVMGARFHPEEELTGQVDAALAPVIARKLPLLWWIGPATRPADLGDQLLRRGLTLVEEVPGMAVDLGDAADDPSDPPTLDVRELRDGQDLSHWLAIFRFTFELPDVAVAFFARAMETVGSAPEIPYRHYLGFWNGEPVACASFFLGHSALGIYNVATLPDFRGRGIGAAMSRWPMRLARTRGYETAVLHATVMGRPVYERLGFRECCRLAVYLWQPTL